MNGYTQLTRDQRYQMYGLRQAGKDQTQIAESLRVHKSTICRELKRNVGLRGWRPKQAHEMAASRQAGNDHAVKFTDEDWDIVDTLLQEDWSPEQISGRLRLEKRLEIGHETIYLHVYADKRTGGDLWKHLRCQKKRRKRYGSGKSRRGIIANRVGIEARPNIVERRTRLGDIEGDTVVGISNRGAMVTLVDRKSKLTCAEILPGKEAAPVTASVTSMLEPYRDHLHTITFDNGTEFSGHEAIASALNVDVYFARPYHSWERGLNENTNGLLRQYFPKGTDFRTVTQPQVDEAVRLLNNRPRKTLGFKTPIEVHTRSSWGRIRRFPGLVGNLVRSVTL